MFGMATRSQARLAEQRRRAAQTVASATAPFTPPRADSAGVVLPEESPGDKCAICQHGVNNKCQPGSCRHQFCYGCLKEWSNEKAVCPLCMTKMSTIRHNFRVIDGQEVFDTYEVPVPEESGSPGDLSDLPPFLVPEVVRSVFPSPLLSTYSARDIASLLGIPASLRDSDPRMWPLPRGMSVGLLPLNPIPNIVNLNTLVNDGRPRRHATHRPLNPDAWMTAREVLYATNPFATSDETAGAELFPAEEFRSANGSQSYQRRRRVYDRGQYAQNVPSAFTRSARVPGTDHFSSAEYFRRHQSAYARISPWLRRELTVLLGLTATRSQLVSLYDVIVSVLRRYNILSRDFRDLIKIYFVGSAQVRHFQYEFYHFALSGMDMEEYDATVTYAPRRRDNQPSAEDGPIPVVTIDDDNDNDNGASAAPVETDGAARPGSPPASVVANGSDDECVLLGVVPIVKPPPLDIITIDSDASDNEESTTSQLQTFKTDTTRTSALPSNSANNNPHSGVSVIVRPSSSRSTLAPTLHEVADSPSSTPSIFVLEEVIGNQGQNSGNIRRPMSPQPSTSAAARAGMINQNHGRTMNKDSFLLRRMFNDLDRHDQGTSDSDDGSDHEEEGGAQSNTKRGTKRKRESTPGLGSVGRHVPSVSRNAFTFQDLINFEVEDDLDDFELEQELGFALGGGLDLSLGSSVFNTMRGIGLEEESPLYFSDDEFSADSEEYMDIDNDAVAREGINGELEQRSDLTDSSDEVVEDDEDDEDDEEPGE